MLVKIKDDSRMTEIERILYAQSVNSMSLTQLWAELHRETSHRRNPERVAYLTGIYNRRAASYGKDY